MAAEHYPLTAFISVADTTNVEVLAQTLYDTGYQLVSHAGNTADTIRCETGLEVVDSLDFLGRWAPELQPDWNKPTKRSRIAAELRWCLSLPREELEAQGRPVIDFADIGLSRDRPDTSGMRLIEAAIAGQRFILVKPEQIRRFTTFLDTQLSGEQQRRELLEYAEKFLNTYADDMNKVTDPFKLFDVQPGNG